MGSSTSFIKTLASHAAQPEHRLTRMGVNLRKSGLIEKSGRGPYASAFKPTECVYLILAMMGTETDSDATDVAKMLASLRSTGENFGDRLGAILSDPEMADRVNRITVQRNHPYAAVHWIKDFEKVGPNGFEEEIKEFKAETETESPGMAISTTLNGGVLRVLSRLFQLHGSAEQQEFLNDQAPEIPEGPSIEREKIQIGDKTVWIRKDGKTATFSGDLTSDEEEELDEIRRKRRADTDKPSV